MAMRRVENLRSVIVGLVIVVAGVVYFVRHQADVGLRPAVSSVQQRSSHQAASYTPSEPGGEQDERVPATLSLTRDNSIQTLVVEPSPDGVGVESSDPAKMLVNELDAFRNEPSLTNAHFVVMRSVRWIMDAAGTSVDTTDLVDNPLSKSPLLQVSAEDDRKYITFTNTGINGHRQYKVDREEFPAFTQVTQLCFSGMDMKEHVDDDLKVLVEQLAQDALHVRRGQ